MRIFLTSEKVIELAYNALDMSRPDPDKVHSIAERMDMVYNEDFDLFEDVEKVSLRESNRTIKSLREENASLRSELETYKDTNDHLKNDNLRVYEENASLRQQLAERDDLLKFAASIINGCNRYGGANLVNGEIEQFFLRYNGMMITIEPSPSQEQPTEICSFCGWPKCEHRNGKCYHYSDEDTDYFYSDKVFQSPKEPSPVQEVEKQKPCEGPYGCQYPDSCECAQKKQEVEKPDFERIYITRCAQTTASNVWDQYVSPLQSRIAELEAENEELRKKIERDNDRLKGYTD